jgi:putative SOS response-associated peptidase YedK
MCGRYRRTSSEEELAKRYHVPIPIQSDLPISWNIAPSQRVLTIRRNPETGEHSLDALKWGLIPNWSKDGKVQYSTINARSETVDTSAVYRGAFKNRRCLIPADSFYEWKRVDAIKIPYNIGLKSGEPFVFAGLWEGWRKSESDEWLRTCTIMTTQPNEITATIHNRMPVILPEAVQEAWLSGEAGKEVLVPYASEEMTAWPISTRVNSPRNNDPSIIDQV